MLLFRTVPLGSSHEGGCAFISHAEYHKQSSFAPPKQHSAMPTRTTILWLVACANAYETWHLVDLAQVICPKPTSTDANAPLLGEYNLGINYTNELQVDAPHIIGFIRASGQALSITFKVEDYYGEQAELVF